MELGRDPWAGFRRKVAAVPTSTVIICWEPTDPSELAVEQARHLYEATIDPAERIPWAWIARAAGYRPSRDAPWRPHLILAADAEGDRRGPVLGFYYGSFIRDYGGYGCYLSVDPHTRGRGVATRLFRELIDVLRRDAHGIGESLPFVIWDSHRPAPSDPPEAWSNWLARLRLFEKVGGRWIAGANFAAPNYADPDGQPVPLELFLIPVDETEAAFDDRRLRGVVEGLRRRVYRMDESDEPFRRAMAAPRPLALRPAGEAT
jgi:GNAT superfamily N-acetyltransferase